jgi:hypothetical protein
VVYEERYGVTIKNIAVVGICALLAGSAPLLEMLVLQVAAVVLFGGAAIVLLAGMLSRHVALRLDPEGITLGGIPLRYRATTVTMPWSDVTAVVLWRQKLPHGNTMSHIGLARRAGLPPVPGLAAGSISREITERLIPEVPSEVAVNSRAVNGWRVHVPRLAATIRAVAPHVEFVDLT